MLIVDRDEAKRAAYLYRHRAALMFVHSVRDHMFIEGAKCTGYECPTCGFRWFAKNSQARRKERQGMFFVCTGILVMARRFKPVEPKAEPETPKTQTDPKISPIYFKPTLEPVDKQAAMVVAPAPKYLVRPEEVLSWPVVESAPCIAFENKNPSTPQSTDSWSLLKLPEKCFAPLLQSSGD